MARRIRWSRTALRDLTDIREFVEQDAPTRARALGRRIEKAVLRLRRFPLSGRLVPGFEESGLREVIVPPYRIVYDVASKDVIVVRVWHGRRDLDL